AVNWPRPGGCPAVRLSAVGGMSQSGLSAGKRRIAVIQSTWELGSFSFFVAAVYGAVENDMGLASSQGVGAPPDPALKSSCCHWWGSSLGLMMMAAIGPGIQ